MKMTMQVEVRFKPKETIEERLLGRLTIDEAEISNINERLRENRNKISDRSALQIINRIANHLDRTENLMKELRRGLENAIK